MKKLLKAMSMVLVAAVLISACPTALAIPFNHRNDVLSGGMSHTLAVKKNGTVWAWGSNKEGQLGISMTVQEIDEPQQVPGVNNAISVAAGSNFSAALLKNGNVYAWGAGKNTPAQVPGLSGISAISAGQNVLIALNPSGLVWQWNAGEDMVAEKVNGLPSNISAISAGGGHFLALTRTGDVWAWGRNDVGQLGIGNADKSYHAVPAKVSGLFDISGIAAGFSHSLALDFDGKMYAWGDNTQGQLGDRSRKSSSVPVSVSSGGTQMIVTAGMDSSMSMSLSGTIYTWGTGKYGQTGSGANSATLLFPEPLKVKDTGRFVYVASGHRHSLAVNDKGEVFAWGLESGKGFREAGDLTAQVKFKLVDEGDYSPGEYRIQEVSGLSPWAQSEVSELYKKEIVSPTMWQNFQNPITRAEFAHLMVDVHEKAAYSLMNLEKTPKFKDIESHYLRKDIEIAYDLGLINGRSRESFAPDEKVTRQEAAKMLSVLADKIEYAVSIPKEGYSLSYYSDEKEVDEWAAPYVAFAHDNKIILGTNGKFDPRGNITKEQALLIVARMIKRYGWSA